MERHLALPVHYGRLRLNSAEESPDVKIISERLNPDFGYFYSVDQVVAEAQTSYQHLQIVSSPEFGKVMLLDGITQVAEKNEFLYHEPMVHPALVSHPNPQDICVIGAGDGGIVREVLKHQPRRVVHAELDGGVIDFCKQELPGISQGCWDNPAVELEVGDGRAYIERQEQAFDVVIMDMTDPFVLQPCCTRKNILSRLKQV